MGLVNLRALKRQIEELANRCRCTKIRVVNVVGVVPDTEQQNTIQVLTNNEIWFVACDGEVVLLGLTEGVMTCTDVLACIGIEALGGDAGAFLNEQGDFVGITVVSADVGNDLSTGTDGGAFFNETINVSADAGNDLSTGGDGGAYLDLSTENIALEHFGINIDEGAVVSTGYKGRLIVPYAGTITGWTILETSETPISGSIVVDVLLGTYANYDTTPTFASIAGTEKPTLSNAVANRDLTLTTWTTAVAVGDIIQFSVDSAATVEKVYVSVHITRA